jgi:DNA modification methylase
MEFFIQSLTEPGEVVADFFCGSGTTLLAAARHGREFIGCDVNPDAVKVSCLRLQQEMGINPDTSG